MKKINVLLSVVLIVIAFSSCTTQSTHDYKSELTTDFSADTVDATNNFYDNAETHLLKMSQLSVIGEIAEDLQVDFSKLSLHSLIVKETLISDDGDKFVGAYRYDGYSLYDILNNCKLQKANQDTFPPIIDLFVEVENNKGEKVVISWGELYYPVHLHEIIIAKSVMRIVPSKTFDLWPLPTESKLVIASDLITERNISSPTKITIKSYPIDLKVQKGLKPLYSPELKIWVKSELKNTISSNPTTLQNETFHTIFYGRGRGIHSTSPYTGVLLKEIMAEYTKITKANLQTGIFVVAAKDGYRGCFSFSELMNRNDQSEVLLVCDKDAKHNGIFRVFPACDFFSDRAIKGINDIYFFNE